MCFGKGWDEMVGRRDRPDTGFIPNSQYLRVKILFPDRTNGKNVRISHPFLSFRLKFDSDPARISLYLHLTRPFIHHHGDKRSSKCLGCIDRRETETMKIVFWFNLALHRIQLGGYKLICPYGSLLNSIFLFISTLLHISNIRLDSVFAWLGWPWESREGRKSRTDTIK